MAASAALTSGPIYAEGRVWFVRKLAAVYKPYAGRGAEFGSISIINDGFSVSI